MPLCTDKTGSPPSCCSHVVSSSDIWLDVAFESHEAHAALYELQHAPAQGPSDGDQCPGDQQHDFHQSITAA